MPTRCVPETLLLARELIRLRRITQMLCQSRSSSDRFHDCRGSFRPMVYTGSTQEKRTQPPRTTLMALPSATPTARYADKCTDFPLLICFVWSCTKGVRWSEFAKHIFDQRPHLVFAEDGVTPVALTNGVKMGPQTGMANDDQSFTLLRPLRTKGHA